MCRESLHSLQWRVVHSRLCNLLSQIESVSVAAVDTHRHAVRALRVHAGYVYACYVCHICVYKNIVDEDTIYDIV